MLLRPSAHLAATAPPHQHDADAADDDDDGTDADDAGDSESPSRCTARSADVTRRPPPAMTTQRVLQLLCSVNYNRVEKPPNVKICPKCCFSSLKGYTINVFK